MSTARVFQGQDTSLTDDPCGFPRNMWGGGIRFGADREAAREFAAWAVLQHRGVYVPASEDEVLILGIHSDYAMEIKAQLYRDWVKEKLDGPR